MVITGTIEELKELLDNPEINFTDESRNLIMNMKTINCDNKLEKLASEISPLPVEQFTIMPPREAHKHGKKSLISIEQEKNKPIEKGNLVCILKGIFEGIFIEDMINDGIDTMREIFEYGTPKEEWWGLQEKTLDKVLASKNIKEFAKLAACRYKSGETVKALFETQKKDFKQSDFMFMFFLAVFCKDWGEVATIASYENHTDEIFKKLNSEQLQGANSGLARSKKTEEKREYYLKLCSDSPKLSKRKINDQFYEKFPATEGKTPITSKTLSNWRKKAGL